MPRSRGQKPKRQSNKSEVPKTIGLFDHIKHIQYVRDPRYYEKLSEQDKKAFKSNLFLILRGLSMNPSFVDCAAYLYQYLDIIPPAQFYQILLELYPKHRYKEFYRWIKSKKNKDGIDARKEKTVLDLVVKKYEISRKEAADYVKVFRSTKQGKEELFDLCRGYGLTDKEVEAMV